MSHQHLVKSNEFSKTRILAKTLKKFLEQTPSDAFVMLPGQDSAGKEISVRCLEYHHCTRGRVYVHTRNPDWESYDAQNKECTGKTQILYAESIDIKKDALYGRQLYCLRSGDIIKYLGQCYADAVVMLPGIDFNGIALHSVEYDSNKNRVYLHGQNPNWQVDENGEASTQVLFVKAI